MTEFYFPLLGGTHNLRLYGSAAPFEASGLRFDFPGGTAEFAFAHPVTIPDFLVSTPANATGNYRLLELKTALADKFGKALRSCEDDLATLQRGTFDAALGLNSAGAYLMGISSFAGAASLTAQIRLDWAALLTTQVAVGVIAFEARLEALYTANLNTPFLHNVAEGRYALSIQAVAAAAGRFDLKAAARLFFAGLESLDIAWPSIPAIGGGSFDFPSLTRFLTLPLPMLQPDLQFTQAPVFQVQIAGGVARLTTLTPGDGSLLSNSVAFTGLRVELDQTGVRVEVATLTAQHNPIQIPVGAIWPNGPFKVDVGNVALTPVIALNGNIWDYRLSAHFAAVTITSKKDPLNSLTATFDLEIAGAAAGGAPALSVQNLQLSGSANAATVLRVLGAGASRVLSIALEVLNDATTVLDKLFVLIEEALEWLVETGSAGARALSGLSEAIVKLLAKAAKVLRGLTPVGEKLRIEVRLDPRSYELLQVRVSRAAAIRPPLGGKIKLSSDTGLLQYEIAWPVDAQAEPVLIWDRGQDFLGLVAPSPAYAKLSTDLWLEPENKPGTELLTGPGAPGGGAAQPLISVTLTPNGPMSVVLAALHGGRPRLFQTAVDGPTAISDVASIDLNAVTASVDLQTDRVLSVFRRLSPETPDALGQSISVALNGSPTVVAGGVRIPVLLTVNLTGSALPPAKMDFIVDLSTFHLTMAGVAIVIPVKKDAPFDVCGLSFEFDSEIEKPDADGLIRPLELDFSDGSARFGLRKNYRLEVSYDRISMPDTPLRFIIDKFAVDGGGISLSGDVAREPVKLKAVEQAFEFSEGRLVIENSEIRAFTIAGSGSLPPSLVGEAKASIRLNFCGRGGRLVLQAGEAVLDKTGEPLRCEGTRFSFNIDRLGLGFAEDEQEHYHFYFKLTGSAQFKPNGSEFSEGLLKHLRNTKIILHEAPLTSDPSVLLSHIEFQTRIEPPIRTTLFDVFPFELRAVGFHPRSPAFDGSPALSISGQVGFTGGDDVPAVQIDFHKMWIAPGEGGLPRIRFDGLGLNLSLGAAGRVQGTAMALDGDISTLNGGLTPPTRVTAKGFGAEVRITLNGLASMSGAMAFVELKDPSNDANPPVHAAFLYGQQNEQAELVATPVKQIYLREYGLGIGWQYTLTAIAAIETATSPQQMISILDPLSKMQGDLDKLPAWTPQYPKGDRRDLTLAMRGMFSIEAASPPTGPLNLEAEKDLPNPLLFDIVAALRTDLTFLMNVRAWVAYNYADWKLGKDGGGAEWQQRPSMRGYMFVSAPRQELLARLIYDKGAPIGSHPKLWEPLQKAMTQIDWSSTLYIRPGLFHFEFGWPYEIKYEINTRSDNIWMKLEGGLVLRIEDGAMLYGMAIRGEGHLKLGASSGGSFGASVRAEASFNVAAKLIAYLSTRDSKSMLYGDVSFSVTITFSVDVWLNARFFSLSASFSLSVTIDVAVQLALSPDGMGARVHASVAIRAFGRSLRLGVGFSLNSDLVGECQSRSERFLSLGLGATYPDPETGLGVQPQPVPAAAPGAGALDRDRAVQAAAERPLATPEEVDAPAPDTIYGEPIRSDTDYFAVLYPLPDTEEYVLVQLLPVEPNSARGQFYAAPWPGITATYKITAGPTCESYKVQESGKPAVTRIQGETIWTAPIRFGSTEFSVGEYFRHGCFLDSPKPDAFTDCRFVGSIDYVSLPSDPEKKNRAIAAAARSHDVLCPKTRRENAIHQARSTFIATVGQAASEFANAIRGGSPGTFVAALPEDIEFDPSTLGLTFIVKVSDLSKLSAMKVVTETPSDGTNPQSPEGAGGVAILNPRETWFSEASPILAEVNHKKTSTGVELYWDLEPGFDEAIIEGLLPQLDPETLVKHYMIERVYVSNSGAGSRTRFQTAKGSDPIELHLTGFRVLTSRLQFVDDLADLLESDRLALLDPTAEYAGGRLSYQIVPVDISGQRGVQRSYSVELPATQPRPVAYKRANLQVTPRDLTGGLRALALSIDTAAEDESGGFAPPKALALRFRKRKSEWGVFGSDAIASHGSPSELPSPDQLGDTDNDLDLTLRKTTSARSVIEVTFNSAKSKVLDQSGSAAGDTYKYEIDFAAVEAFLSPADPKDKAKPDLTKDVVQFDLLVRPDGDGQKAPWVNASITLIGPMIQDDPAKKQLEITSDTMELPRHCDLDWVASADLATDDGRVYFAYPDVDSTFDAFALKNRGLSLSRDSQRRTGVVLKWKSKGLLTSSRAKKSAVSEKLAGSYRLFSVEPGIPGEVSDPPQVKSLGEVFAASRVAQSELPAETGDFAKIDYAYPSLTARLPLKGRRLRNSQARLAPPAAPETERLIWPARSAHRFLFPTLDDSAVERLFSRDFPTKLTIDVAEIPGASQTVDVTDVSVEGVRTALFGAALTTGADAPVLHLTVTGKTASGGVTGSFEADLVCQSDLHPFLSDLVERLRLDTVEDGAHKATFRRYEPLIEAAPRTPYASIFGFMDNTTPQRDPAGWGILRSLGLGVALRLYDMQSARFLTGRETQKRVNAAVQALWPSYEKSAITSSDRRIKKLGQTCTPFVDVLLVADRGLRLVPHGQAAPVSGGLTAEIADASAGLIQIELRPLILSSPRRLPQVAKDAEDNWARIQDVLARRGEWTGPRSNVAPTSDELSSFIARWPEWARRFYELNATPANGREDIKSSTEFRVAVAYLSRPEPWTASKDRDGFMSALMLEKDRYGKDIRYAVLPVSRYQALQDAVSTAKTSLPPLEHNAQTVDAVVERTEPVAAPVIVGVRRRPSASKGEIFDIVTSGHSDESMSEANQALDMAVAHNGVHFSMWRTFPYQPWADAFNRDVKMAFGPQHPDVQTDIKTVQKPEEIIDAVSVAWRRTADIHRGGSIRAVHNLPYGFNYLATAHAQSGVVVSDISVASLGSPSGKPNLGWPCISPPDPVPETLWHNKPLPTPTAKQRGDRTIELTIPLMRLVDSIDKGVAELWFGPGPSYPDLFDLADPLVAYRLMLASADGQSRIPLADILPAPTSVTPFRVTILSTLVPKIDVPQHFPLGRDLGVVLTPNSADWPENAVDRIQLQVLRSGDAPLTYQFTAVSGVVA